MIYLKTGQQDDALKTTACTERKAMEGEEDPTLPAENTGLHKSDHSWHGAVSSHAVTVTELARNRRRDPELGRRHRRSQ